MLLKVEAYSGKQEVPRNGLPPPIQPPMYVCLQTAQAQNNQEEQHQGRLLTMGRKAPSNVIFAQDKSVSREHCRLRLVTTNKTLGEPRPLASRNAAEQAACAASALQCCVVVENVGKLGTYVVLEVEPPPPPPKKKAKRNDDDDSSATDDDETDDEGVPSAAALASQLMRNTQQTGASTIVAVSEVAQRIVGKGKQTRLELVQSLPLTTLEEDCGRVILQCGQMGATVVLTRIPLRYVGSSSLDKNLPWMTALHAIGAEKAETLTWEPQDAPTTHYVVPTYKPTTNQLAAWSRGIPFVSPEYMQAMWDRRNATDPLPQAADYPPDEAETYVFLTQPAIPRPWRGTVYYSVKCKTASEKEMECLAAAAGARILRIYELAVVSKDAANEIEKVLTEALQDVIQGDDDFDNDNHDQQHFFGYCLRDPRRAKNMAAALKQMHATSITVKECAKALSEQRTLDGRRVPTTTTTKEVEAAAQDKTKTTAAPTPKAAPPAAKTVPPSGEEKNSKTAETSLVSSTTQDAGSLSKRRRDDAAEEDGNEKEADKAREGKHGSKKARCDVVLEDIAEEKNEAPQDESVDMDTGIPDEPEEDVDPMASLAATKEMSSHEEETNSRTLATSTGSSDLNKGKDGTKAAIRPTTVTTKEGWLTTGTTSARSKEEIMEMTGMEEVVQTHKTEQVEGLLVRQPGQKIVNLTKWTSKIRKRASGPDFRGFRKNKVPHGRNKTRFTLKVDIRNDTSQANVDYEQHRQAIAEQQRRADELFRDPRASAPSRSRSRGR